MMEYKNSIVVAVTGGMGCGQTTVCKFLAEKGVKVFNADQIAKQEIERNEEIKRELKKVFGSRVFYRNGRLNRKLLARIAFSDAAKTQRLNKIVHPQMVARIVEMIEQARESGKYPIIAVDAALIYELNLEHMFDAVVVVGSRMSKRIARIKERDKLTEKEIIDRFSKQIPIEDKMAWADYVIENNGDLEELKKKTNQVYQKLMRRVRNKTRPRRSKSKTTR